MEDEVWMLSDINLHKSILTYMTAKEQTAQQMPSQPYHCQLVFVLHMEHEPFWCLQSGFVHFQLWTVWHPAAYAHHRIVRYFLQIMEISWLVWSYRSLYSGSVSLVHTAGLTQKIKKTKCTAKYADICAYIKSTGGAAEVTWPVSENRTFRTVVFYLDLLFSASRQDPQLLWNIY